MGRKYKLWWSGNGVGGVGVMVKEVLCEHFVEIWIGDIVMAVVLKRMC